MSLGQYFSKGVRKMLNVEITQAEILRRLKLIRDIRIKYIKLYNITKDEIPFNYHLLQFLDEADYVLVKTSTYSFYTVEYGKFATEEIVTTYDPVKDILYNQGEQQGYWGDSQIISGNFMRAIGNILVDKYILSKEYTDEQIIATERKVFMDVLKQIAHGLETDISCEEERLERIQNRVNGMIDRLVKIQQYLQENTTGEE